MDQTLVRAVADFTQSKQIAGAAMLAVAGAPRSSMPSEPSDPTDELPDRPEHVERLAALRAFEILDSSPEVEFDRLVRLAAQLCDTPMAAISIVDRRRLWFKATHGLSLTEMDLSAAFCTQGVQQAGFFQVPDARRDPRYRDNPLVTATPGLRFYAGYPLRTQAGHALGMLAVLDTQPRALTPAQREQLQTLSMLAMITLELRRKQRMLHGLLGRQAQSHAVLEHLTADVARLGYWRLEADAADIDWSDEALAVVGRARGQAPDMAELLEMMRPASREPWKAALAACFASAVPMDEEGGMTVAGRDIHVRWLASPERDAGGRVVRLLGVLQDVSEFRQVENDAHRWNERFRLVAQLTSDALWEWDIVGDGIWWGERMFHLLGEHRGVCGQRDALQLVHPDDRTRVEREVQAALDCGAGTWSSRFRLARADGSHAWVEDRAQIVRDPDGKAVRMVGCLKDVSEQVEMEERRRRDERRIHQLAFFDQLTGLPNRVSLLDRLQHALASSFRHRQFGALMFLDLDNFKTLNDTLGHDIGDALLRQVGQRLHDGVRAVDTVARLGGDEFVILLEELGDSAVMAALQAETTARKILAAFKRPFDLGAVRHDCTTSIGVTVFEGETASIDELLKQADLAMYESKQAGRNTVRFFDPRMQELVLERATLEADLRRASLQHEFVLHYQPQWDRDGRLIGLEALVRWMHPQRGLVYPDAFIPACEETGFILPLGRWALQQACEQLAAWRAAGLRSVLVSVNVSARQMRSPQFVDDVRAALASTGARADCLKLELTESMLLDHVESSIEKMQDLKRIGVRFALDDFGTGFSSLSLLRRLPLDQLKIDQSFVQGLDKPGNDGAVVQSIISLGKNLQMKIIAEGIETFEQHRLLSEFGCDEFQGFLHGRSMSAAAAEALVDAH